MTRICEFCSCELVLKLNTIPEESVGKPDACGTPLEAKSYPYFECPKCSFTYLWYQHVSTSALHAGGACEE